jgi:hypothetical protein
MNSQRFLLAGVVGGIVFFLLGYLLHGLALKSFFDQNGMAVDMDKIIWWAMAAGNLAGGFTIAYILGKANVTSVGSGAAIGLVAGLFIHLGFDFIMYGLGKGMNTLQAVAADVAVGAVISAVAGACIGMIYASRKVVATA